MSNAEAVATLRSVRYKRARAAKAKLEDFRFHNRRHTFVSRLVGQGVSSYVVQHAGGWRAASMMAAMLTWTPRRSELPSS